MSCPPARGSVSGFTPAHFHKGLASCVGYSFDLLNLLFKLFYFLFFFYYSAPVPLSSNQFNLIQRIQGLYKVNRILKSVAERMYASPALALHE